MITGAGRRKGAFVWDKSKKEAKRWVSESKGGK
jgi:hypothetical protein